MKSIIISKHTLFIKNDQNIFSTGSSIESFLIKNDTPYICIKHPLNNVSSSLGEDFVKNRKINSVKMYPSSLVELFRKGKLEKQIITYKNSSFLPLKTIH